MPASQPFRRKPNACSLRPVVCLFLAVLFLYNPFFVIAGPGHGLHVRHPLSYRATVANSELSNYTVGSEKPPAVVAALLTREPTQPTAEYPSAAIQPHDFRSSTPQANCNSLYFRPPPRSPSLL
jgi:hypothetical protein